MAGLKTKLTLTQIIKLQIAVLSAAIILAILFASFFLYQNIYKTITSTDEIIVLRSQIALETIDTQILNKVLTDIKNKKIVPEINWTTFRNPFLPYTTKIEEE
ncbi:hypothetical protein HQ544_03650 [Candidatus Falkowbacteria bacterium]|nr:hypothetical protein [Candidatus Falkowbacteria bacterium]